MANWSAIAASQTAANVGVSGAIGDELSHLIVIPATTSPGSVQIKDGGGTAVTVFTGGASSISNLVPFTVALSIVSVLGGWKITTGANVSVVAVGNFR